MWKSLLTALLFGVAGCGLTMSMVYVNGNNASLAVYYFAIAVVNGTIGFYVSLRVPEEVVV